MSAYLDGEYGQSGLHISVPVILGKDGIEEVIELNLTSEEKRLFDESCNAIKEYILLADTI